MSRFEKDENENPNPAERFFDWVGDSSDGQTGSISYYDKIKKEKVTVPMPFQFWVIDKVTQVTGGIDRNGKFEGFWSNAVKNPAKQKLIVRSKAGIEAQGYWVEGDLKGRDGFKYMTGLYIGFVDNGEMRLGYFKVKGSALTAWIETTKEYRDIYEGSFTIVGSEKRKKGSNTYYVPVFEHAAETDKETLDDLQRVYFPLRDYLQIYFNQNPALVGERAEDDSGVEIEHTDEFSGPADRDINDDFYKANADSGKPQNEDSPELIALCQELNKFEGANAQWTPGKLKDHVQEQFDKPLNNLNADEMEILINDMTETLKERRAMATEAATQSVADSKKKKEAAPAESMITANQLSTIRRLLDIKEIEEKDFLKKASADGSVKSLEELTEAMAKETIKALQKPSK